MFCIHAKNLINSKIKFTFRKLLPKKNQFSVSVCSTTLLCCFLKYETTHTFVRVDNSDFHFYWAYSLPLQILVLEHEFILASFRLSFAAIGKTLNPLRIWEVEL